MKVTLYMDVYPGWDMKYATATAMCNYEKGAGSHRLKFTVDVPDWMVTTVTQPDHVAEVSRVEEV